MSQDNFTSGQKNFKSQKVDGENFIKKALRPPHLFHDYRRKREEKVVFCPLKSEIKKGIVA